MGGTRFATDPTRRKGAAAFTLLEVALAIAISVGMLVVVLYFYRQASRLRADLLRQTEQVTSARLLMQRLTAELRAATIDEVTLDSLTGESNSIEFVTTVLPGPSAWGRGDLGRVLSPQADLHLVSYSLASDGTGTNFIGLNRSDEPLVEWGAGTNSDLFAGSSSTDLSGTDTNEEDFFFWDEPAAPALNTMLSPDFQYLQFRYWDGSAWLDSWYNVDLPLAVEVTLGIEPPPEESEATGTEIAKADYELFRRVIFLPQNRGPSVLANSSDSSDGFDDFDQPAEPGMEDLP